MDSDEKELQELRARRHLYGALLDTLNRHRAEYDLSECEVIGVIEQVKLHYFAWNRDLYPNDDGEEWKG